MFFARCIDSGASYAQLSLGKLRSIYWQVRGAKLGGKCRFGPRTMIESPWNFRAGKRCIFESDLSIKLVGKSGVLTVGDHVYIGRFSQFDILGRCTIGSHVLVATGAMVIDHNHGLSAALRIDEQPCTVKNVQIGNDVWLGAYSVVLPGVHIGDGAVVAAHACVTKNVPAGGIVAGVPARVIGHRTD